MAYSLISRQAILPLVTWAFAGEMPNTETSRGGSRCELCEQICIFLDMILVLLSLLPIAGCGS